MSERIKELLRRIEERGQKERILKSGFVAFLAILLICAVFLPGNDKGQDVVMAAEEDQEMEVVEEINSRIIVDVAGQVNDPKVVELDSGSRVQDAIEAAGGLTDKADLSTINRAAFVNDGEKIYIPKKGEGESTQTQTSDTAKTATKVNINTAGDQELQTLKGVGPATAQKIITYRSAYGSFGSIEDIKKVEGIGDKTYENIKDDIRV